MIATTAVMVNESVDRLMKIIILAKSNTLIPNPPSVESANGQKIALTKSPVTQKSTYPPPEQPDVNSSAIYSFLPVNRYKISIPAPTPINVPQIS